MKNHLKRRRFFETGGALYEDTRRCLIQPFGGIFERVLPFWFEIGIMSVDVRELGEGFVFAGCPVKFYIVSPIDV